MNNLLTPIMLPKQKSQLGEWIIQSHTVAYTEGSKGWMTYTLPSCCLYKRANRLNDLLTPILLPVLKSKEGEWLTHLHTAAYKKIQEGKLHTRSHDVPYMKGPREWMTYSIPHCCLYRRVKRVNDLLTPTLLPLQKSQQAEWLTPILLPVLKSK